MAACAFSSSVGEVTKFSSALHIHWHTMHTCTGRHCENTYSCMCMHTHIHTHLKKSFISWLICLSRCLRQTISFFFLPGASVPADSISENRLHPGPLFGSWLMACSFFSTSTFLPHPHFGRLSWVKCLYLLTIWTQTGCQDFLIETRDCQVNLIGCYLKNGNTFEWVFLDLHRRLLSSFFKTLDSINKSQSLKKRKEKNLHLVSHLSETDVWIL